MCDPKNNLKAYLQYFLEGYATNKYNPFKDNEFRKKVRSNAKEAVPESILEDNRYIVKAFCGQGLWAQVPLLAIFDESITTSATKGYYIAFLFRNDCSGVYMSLNQGYTYFQEMFKKLSKENVLKVSEYWREKLSTVISGDDKLFSVAEIDLRVTGRNNRLPRGYELGNIVSKYYSKSDLERLTEDNLRSDLEHYMKVYRDLCAMLEENFEEQINRIIAGNLNQEAENIINKKNIERFELELMTKIPENLEFEEKGKTRRAIMRDYLVLQEEQNKNGLDGEIKVLEYEKVRLTKHKLLKSKIDNIKHVSRELGDGLGYDILSFDILEDRIQEIYIEVKTTKGDITRPFFMTPNEIEFAREKQGQYRIYRLYKGESGQWQYYVIENPLSQYGEKIQYEAVNFKVLPKS